MTYVSRAREGLTDAEVFTIYRNAMYANTLDGISGLLVYDGAVFVQILEGGETALSELRNRLRNDDRHQAINVVDYGFVSRCLGKIRARLQPFDSQLLRASC